MKKSKFKLENPYFFLLIALVLILMTFSTKYYGSADIGDYADTAKFFAEKYPADIRSSHSYLYGFIHSSFVYLTNSFVAFKISSLIFLFLTVFSVYLITNKNKRAAWLMILAPIVWYMAPWINPLQLAGLLLLWSFYFIDKYQDSGKVSYLFYSGLLLGLGWAFWDTILFFGFFLAIVYLYDKKLINFAYYSAFVLLGLLPRLILDQLIFNFAFYSILKSFFGTLANLSGGIYLGQGHSSLNIFSLISLFLAIPLMYWTLYKPSNFKKYKREIVFLSLCLMLILFNPQIRYIISIAPIMILLLSKQITKKQFKIQVIFSIIVLILFISPYIIQTKYSVDETYYDADFQYILSSKFLVNINNGSVSDRVLSDINLIANDFPNETFIVGNNPDSYQTLAHLYWGYQITELVSIQDYNSFTENNSILFEKTFMPIPNIQDRRVIWITGGMKRNENDSTKFQNISLAISFQEPLEIDNFRLLKKYQVLSLYEEK
ncbi:MAG: hypothetical protein ABIH72_03105 [archaeon]